MVRRLWTMLRWSLQGRGLRGTVRACWSGTCRFLQKEPKRAIHPFDVRHGTDTSGLISGGRLAVGSASDKHITAYAGVSPFRLSQALQRWSDGMHEAFPARYTFVDLGCGKGRALLLASEYPFRKVLGIELNPGLADIARDNERIWRASDCGLSPVEVRTGDATEFTLPAGNCLLFLYNPFGPIITRAVLDAVDRQMQHRTDDVFLLYQNEADSTPLREDPRLHLVWTESMSQPEDDRIADPVSSPEDVTSLYRWVGRDT